MAEYIDREVAVLAMHEAKKQDMPLFNEGLMKGADIIISMTAAAVVKRKKGLWALVEKRRKASVYRCSECGNFFTVWPDTLNCGRGDMNYCPNCGADMREQEPKTEPAPETYDLLREEGGWNLQ